MIDASALSSESERVTSCFFVPIIIHYYSVNL